MTGPVSSEPKELLESATAASSLLSPSPLSLSRALPATHSLSVAMEAPGSASVVPPALSPDGRGGKTSLASMSPTAASLASPKSNSVFLSLQVSSTSSASTAVPQDECDSAASREDGSPRTPWALDVSGATPKSVSKGFGPDDMLQTSSGETASPVRRARGGRREGLGPEGDEAKKSVSPRRSEETERKASAEDESFEALASAKKIEDCASLGGRVSDSEDPESPCTKELNGNTGLSARAERSSRKAALRRIRQFVGVSGKDAASFGSVSSPGDAASATALEIESLGQAFRAAAERDFLAVKGEENPRRKRVRTEGVPGGSEPASPPALEDGDPKTFRQTLLGREAEAQKPGDDALSSVLADAFLADRDGKAVESNRTTPSVLGDAELRPEVDFARGLAAVAAEIASAQGLGGRGDGDSERSRLLSLASALGKAEGQFVGDRVSEPREGATSSAAQELGPGPLPGDLLEEGRRLLSSPAGLSVWLECASNASSSLSKRPNEGLPADLVALSASLMHEEASNGPPTPRVLGLRGPAGLPDTEESPSHLHGAALDAFGLQLGSEGLAARPAGLLGAFAGEKAPRQQKVRAGQKSGDRTQTSRPHALSRGLVASAPSSAGTTPSSYGASLVPHSSSMTSVMVKSVSPAGVVRRGGRNRRKRTKYDLAYRQMEQLGPFAEEAKHVDLSKVSGSSFAVELLKNPHLYSYESWVHGFAWPVGADGRRLLLRKLRGVYWSDPDYWQKRLMAEGLYRRDLFTLATVQELFKVTHLMGADVWDFLLKCTALTHKCDALTAKEGGQSDNEEVLQNASSPEAASPHAGPEVTSQALTQVAGLGGHGETFAWASPPQGSPNDLLVAGAAQEECEKAEQASVVGESEALSSVYPPLFHHSASLELGDTAAPPSPFSGPRLSTGGVISSFESSAEGICAALSLRRPSSGGDREPGLEGEEERPNPVAGSSWLGAEALQELLAGSLSRQERGTGDELMQEEEAPHAAGRQGLFLPPGVLGTAASEQRANGAGQEKRTRGRPRKPRSNLGSLAALREELGLDLAQKGVGPDAADPFGLPGTGGLSNGVDAADGNGGELLGAQTGAQGYPQFSGSSAAVSALNLLKTEEFSGFGAAGMSERGDLSQTGDKEAVNLKNDEFLSSRFLGEGNLQQAHLASSVGASGKSHARGDSGQELGAQASKKRPRLFEGAAPQDGGQLSDLSRLLEEELDASNSAQAREADMDSLRSLMLQVAEAAAAADIGHGVSMRRALERTGACGGCNGSDGVARGPGDARRRSGAGQGLDFLTEEQSGDRDGAASGAMEEEMRQIEILLKALDHHLAESQEQRDERQVASGLAAVGKSEEPKEAALESFSLSPISAHVGPRGAESQLASGTQSPRAGPSSGAQETETGGSPVVAGGDGESQAREAGNGAVADAKALLECVQALASASPVGSLFSTGGLPPADFAASLLFQQKDRKVGVSSAEEARERRAGEATKAAGLEVVRGSAGGEDGAGEANEPEAWGPEAKKEGGQAQTFQLKEKREASGLEGLRGPGSLILKLRSLPARANSNAAVAAAAASSAAMAGSLLWGRDRCGASEGLRRGGDEEARQSALSFLGTLPGIAGVGSKRESSEKKSGDRSQVSACSGAAVLAPALFPSEANPQQPLGSRGLSEALGSLLSGGVPEGGTAAGDVSSSRLLEALASDTHALLQLTAHYSFMAQFMQCAMLFEVQQALLRVIATFRAQERRGPAQSRLSPANCKQGEKRGEDADDSEGPGTDPTMKACLQSLLESGTVHMQFVQLMAQQLRRHVLASAGESRGGGSVSETERRRPREAECGGACGGDEEGGKGEEKAETEEAGEVEAPPVVAGRVAGVLEEEEREKAIVAEEDTRRQSEQEKGDKKKSEERKDEEESERREGSEGGEEVKNELDESSEGTLEAETVQETRSATGSAERRREPVTQEDYKTPPEEEKEMRETTDEETAKQEDSREECL